MAETLISVPSAAALSSTAMTRWRRRAGLAWRPLSKCWHKGRKTRTVKISHDAARTLDRYLSARAPTTPRRAARNCGSGQAAAAR